MLKLFSFSEFVAESLLLESDKNHYKHVKDMDEARPRMAPAPKTEGMTTTTGSGYWDLYLQDQASDVMIDKYGYERGIANWEYTLDQGGAMFQSAAKIANEKYVMLRDLGKLNDYGRDYFKRSYFDIWKEWKEFKTGKKTVTAVKPKVQPENPKQGGSAPTSASASHQEDSMPGGFTAKDADRIANIIARAKGSQEKQLQLARVMANSIDSYAKAVARGRAAEDENYHDIADIFFARAKELKH